RAWRLGTPAKTTLFAGRMGSLRASTPRKFPRGIFANELCGVDVPHGQADAALAVHFQHLHADHVSFLELVADPLDALIVDLRDVHQAVAPGKDGDERAEVHQAGHFTLVDAADFDVGRDQLDAPLRLTAGSTTDGSDFHRAIALDVDGGPGLFRNLTDDRTALADHVANLLRVDLQGEDRRCPLGHGGTRLADDLVHLTQDVQPALARLIERNAHDLRRDTLDLDVHLQSRDAGCGAGHLEIHVAQVILIPEDVGQHLEAAAFEHQAHRHAGHRRLDGDARVHQRQRSAADARHGARAVGFEDLGHDANDIRESLHIRHHGFDATSREVAVADLAPLGRSHHAGLAYRERREVVMQHERLAPLALERVDDLRVAGCAERRDDQSLCLTAGEQRRAMRARQHSDLDRDWTDRLGIAAIDARLAVENALANDVALELEESRVDIVGRELGGVPARQGRRGLRLDFRDARVTLLLLGDGVRLRERRLRMQSDGAGQVGVVYRRLPLPARLAGLRRQLLDGADGDLHLLVSEHDRSQHHFL